MEINITRMANRILLMFLLLCGVTGVISYASVQVDIALLKIWKEVSLLILIFFFVASSRLTYLNNIQVLMLLAMAYMLLVGIYSIFVGLPVFLIIYQWKSDLLLLLFVAYLIMYLDALSDERVLKYAKLITNILLIIGFINSVCVILEAFFPEAFFSLIGFSPGVWGSESGIKIVMAGDLLRPVGLQMGFVQAGTLCLINFCILCDSKLYRCNKLMRYFLMLTALASILLVNYFNALLGLLVYFLFKCEQYFCMAILSKNLNIDNIIYITGIVLFFSFFYITNSLDLYWIFEGFSPNKAYSSIYLRVIQHWDICSMMTEIYQVLFGLGINLNGTYGIDKESLASIIAISTDSTYIYILSNYGVIGLAGTVVMLCYFVKVSRRSITGVHFLLLYVLVISMFFNCYFGDFPSNFIILSLFGFEYRLRKIGNAC